MKCRMLPAGDQKVSNVLLAELYSRLQSHMGQVRQFIAEWMERNPSIQEQINPTESEKSNAHMIFEIISRDWESKHPVKLIDDIISSSNGYLKEIGIISD